MPSAPSRLTFFGSARDDLARIQQHNPDRAERILRKIHQWREHITWGRLPQERLTYLRGPGAYYRERVGNAGYRIVSEISDDLTTVVVVLPKSDRTYEVEEFARRMDRG